MWNTFNFIRWYNSDTCLISREHLPTRCYVFYSFTTIKTNAKQRIVESESRIVFILLHIWLDIVFCHFCSKHLKYLETDANFNCFLHHIIIITASLAVTLNLSYYMRVIAYWLTKNSAYLHWCQKCQCRIRYIEWHSYCLWYVLRLVGTVQINDHFNCTTIIKI